MFPHLYFGLASQFDYQGQNIYIQGGARATFRDPAVNTKKKNVLARAGSKSGVFRVKSVRRNSQLTVCTNWRNCYMEIRISDNLEDYENY